LSISAGATGLEVHVGDKTETIPLKETTDATQTARRFTAEQEPPKSTDTSLAGEQTGSGSGREEPGAARLVRALWRAASDDGDRDARDLARLLLSARDQGAQCDAA